MTERERGARSSRSSWLVRRAAPADRELVHRFHRALYLEHRSAVMPPELEVLYAYRDFPRVLREDVDAMLSNRSVWVLLVAESAEATPVGYATATTRIEARRVLNPKGVLGDWYVAPEARGRGAGGALFDAVVRSLRGEGCEVLETSTWPFNHATRAAMRRLGLEEVQVTYRLALAETLEPDD